jgi:hypothetical protein
MKVLVATADTQGERGNDFHRCVEGELVFLFEPCAHWPVGTVVERRLDDVIVRRLSLFLPR